MTSVWDETMPSNTPVLADDITVEHAGMLRVMVSESIGSVFSIELTKRGTTKILAFNSGAALVADCLYMFDVTVLPGDLINFRFDTATTIHVLDVKWIRV